MLLSRHTRVLLVLGFISCFLYLLLLLPKSNRNDSKNNESVLHNGKDVLENRAKLMRWTSSPFVHQLKRMSNSSVHINGDQSFEANIILRGKLQQAIIQDYCSHFNYSQVTKRNLFNNLLFDDKYSLVYCFVPKTGCTKMKTLFVLLQGLYSLNQLSHNRTITHHQELYKVFSLKHLSQQKRVNRLMSYYKFMIVRNPLERLVSAYRDKLSRPKVLMHYIELQKKIVRQFRQNFTSDSSLHPTFAEFVKYYLLFHDELDDHFQLMVDICHPCTVKYDFYANFQTIDYDIDALLRLMHIPHQYYFNSIQYKRNLMPKPIHSTSQLLVKYYSQLSTELKERLFKQLSNDLHFYYSLYPMEKYLSSLIF